MDIKKYLDNIPPRPLFIVKGCTKEQEKIIEDLIKSWNKSESADSGTEELAITQCHHPRTYRHLLPDALPLKEEGKRIVIERVQVETLEEFRNKIASLEESKPFLPFLDNEIERLSDLEQLHLSRIVGFLVPKETKYVELH